MRIFWRRNLFGSFIRAIYNIWGKKIEEIPDREKVWRLVMSETQLNKNGDLHQSFFKDNSGLSCELEILTTVEDCLANRPPGSGIIEISVGEIRNRFEKVNVTHDPLPLKYSHALIVGVKEGGSSLKNEEALLIAKEKLYTWIKKPDFS